MGWGALGPPFEADVQSRIVKCSLLGVIMLAGANSRFK